MMYREDIEQAIKHHQYDITVAMQRYNKTGDINQLHFANLRKRQMDTFKALLPKARKKPMTPEKAYARKVVGITW